MITIYFNHNDKFRQAKCIVFILNQSTFNKRDGLKAFQLRQLAFSKGTYQHAS